MLNGNSEKNRFVCYCTYMLEPDQIWCMC